MHRSKGRDPPPQNGVGLHDAHHHHLHHKHHHHHLPPEGSLYAYIDNLSNTVSTNTNNNNSKVRDNNNPEGCRSCHVSNKTAPVVVGLPVSVEGAVPRLWATRRCLQYLRSAAGEVTARQIWQHDYSKTPASAFRRGTHRRKNVFIVLFHLFAQRARAPLRPFAFAFSEIPVYLISTTIFDRCVLIPILGDAGGGVLRPALFVSSGM